jgi:mannose-6-phosphate isomerase-like protein (cupin superfamily)
MDRNSRDTIKQRADINMKNLFEELSGASGKWHSEMIGEVDSNPVFVRVMQGCEAPFHVHAASDEMFIVLAGEMNIDLENDSIRLEKGQSFTVAAGTKHRARVPARVELIVIGGKDT